jgi:predicted transcriptional regulator
MSKAVKKDLDIYNLKDTKLTILSISNALSQPKETTRRRVQKLIDYKLLDKNDDGGIVLGENYNQIINANAKKTTQELAKFFRVMKKTWSDDELNDIASGKLDF